jgi:hypothetical protein
MKKGILLFGLLLSVASIYAQTWNVVQSDDFNRDNGPLAGEYEVNKYPDTGFIEIVDNEVKMVNEGSDLYVAIGHTLAAGELPLRLSLTFRANSGACGYGLMAVSENGNSIGSMVYLDSALAEIALLDQYNQINPLNNLTIDINDTLAYIIQMTIETDAIHMSLNDDKGAVLYAIETPFQDTMVFEKLSINTYQGSGVVVCFDDLLVEQNDGSSIFQKSETELEIYPNPTAGKVTFSNLPEHSCAYLYTLSGKMVYNSSNISGSNTLDLSGFGNGVYMLKIVSENKAYCTKVIKK